MAMSEAEFERLYQEFVRKGGGSLTGSNVPGTNDSFFDSFGETVNTPASYYTETNNINLSPSKLAELNAAEEQFNRKQALSIISNELKENNFTNPYAMISSTGIINYNEYNSSPGFNELSTANNSFSLLSSPSYGGSELAKSTILAGVFSNTGLDFDRILSANSLGNNALSMYSSLNTHTSGQITDLPQTLQDADMLSGLNKSFGEQDNSCSLFNELMGIMSGGFDSAFDLLGNAKDQILNILNQAGVMSVFNTLTSDISGLISGLTGNITDNISSLIGSITSMVNGAMANVLGEFPGIKDMLGSIGDFASAALNAVSSVTNQILGEISKIADMAVQISDKLASIAMAAAMLDPCKLSVLMNTGSPALKSAAGLLNAPLPSGLPEFNIPTVSDPRAFVGEVDTIMEDAKSLASGKPGVPQTPFSKSAKLYEPIDGYLHDLDPIPSISDTIENKSSPLGLGQLGQLTMPQIDSLPSISNLDGIVAGGLQSIPNLVPSDLSDLTSQVGNLGNIVGSASDLTALTTSGNSINPIADSLTRSDALSPGISVNTSDASIINTSANEPIYDNKNRKLASLPVRAQVEKSQWRPQIAEQVHGQQKLIRTTLSDIRNYLSSTKTFFQEGQKRQVIILEEELLSYKKTLRNLYKVREEFVYLSPGGDIDNVQEEQILRYYLTEVKAQQQRVIDKIKPKIENITRTWESIKSQSILGPR
jgi:hypothetical protein